jgi:hypothetical protein
LSSRTRATSALSESTINAFTLVPRTRATASASSASSSGDLTVVCFATSWYRDIATLPITLFGFAPWTGGSCEAAGHGRGGGEVFTFGAELPEQALIGGSLTP